MTDLSQAFKKYLTKSDYPTLSGFVNDQPNHKELIVEWITAYTTLEDAKRGLQRKFVSTYKSLYPSKQSKPSTKVDLSVMFEESKTNKKIEKAAMNTLGNATKAAAGKIKIKLYCKKRPQIVSNYTSTQSLSSSSEAQPSPTQTPLSETFSSVQEDDDYILPNNVNISSRLRNHINKCKQTSQTKGFFVDADLHQILASQGIIWLKKDQLDPMLIKEIGLENLNIITEQLQQRYMNKTVKVDDELYFKLCKILRDVDEKANRKLKKTEIMELYKSTSDEDSKLLDILLNCMNKLPNFEKNEPVGEMELSTNFLDPIFSPLFHEPELNKHFIWSNRQDENTESSRLVGVLKSITEKKSSVTLGYCEVKPADSISNNELTHRDLLRLSTFTNAVMLRMENKLAICVQAVEYATTFYCLSEISKNITIMLDVFNFTVPKEISHLHDLLSKFDSLKRIGQLYDEKCQTSYKRDLELDTINLTDIINPKKKKCLNPALSFK